MRPLLAPGRSYNQLMADDVGLTLQLLPMLAGFFTYKVSKSLPARGRGRRARRRGSQREQSAPATCCCPCWLA